MSLKFNPFTPYSPVHRDMFKGRIAELDAIDRSLRQTCSGNPAHLLLIGERGIGKTSLLNVTNHFARGELRWNTEASPHNFLTVRVSLDETMGLTDLAVNLKHSISRELDKINVTSALIKKAWEFVSKFEVGGIAYKPGDPHSKEPSQFVQDFVMSLVDTVKSLRSTDSADQSKASGLVILVDETDKATRRLNVGTFLKSLSETLVAEEANYILFVLCGLPETRDVLTQSHESSLRLFQEFLLKPLSPDETSSVIENGLAEGDKVNATTTTLDPKARELIYDFSEGYPHFVQQIGYSAFEIDSDGVIDESDVRDGMFLPNGALQQIGDRYYVKPFYKDISADSQREILAIMAENWTQWVTREEIKKQFSGKDSTLDNGLRALREKRIIIPREGHLGQYRLQWASFAFWIKNHQRTERRQ